MPKNTNNIIILRQICLSINGSRRCAARMGELTSSNDRPVIEKETKLKAIVAVIEWYGPYTFEEAQKASKFDYDDGLYVVVGKRKNKQLNLLQYIGIATYLNSRLSKNHHKIPKVTRD